MTKYDFKMRLAEAKLTRKDLARLLDLSLSTVNNWGSSRPVPYWMESWLGMYIELKECRELKEQLRRVL